MSYLVFCYVKNHNVRVFDLKNVIFENAPTVEYIDFSLFFEGCKRCFSVKYIFFSERSAIQYIFDHTKFIKYFYDALTVEK